jgi:hypothetical protein
MRVISRIVRGMDGRLKYGFLTAVPGGERSVMAIACRQNATVVTSDQKQVFFMWLSPVVGGIGWGTKGAKFEGVSAAKPYYVSTSNHTTGRSDQIIAPRKYEAPT